MVFLDALLAFAITLLAFSMVVTLLVNFATNKLRLRGQTVINTLTNLYTDYMQFNSTDKSAEEVQRQAKLFVEAMLNYVGLRGAAPGKNDLRDARQIKLALRYLKISPVEEIEEATLHQALSINLFKDKGLDAFDQFGDESGNNFVHYVKSHYFLRMANQQRIFKQKAKQFSYGFAFLLALGFNVNAFDLFNAFVDNAAMRGTVIQSYAQAVQPVAEQLAANAGFDDAKKALQLLKGVDSWQVPVGWQRGGFVAEIKQYSENQLGFWELFKAFLIWLPGIAAAGALIGQGAPFWFDVIQKLLSAKKQLKDGKE